MVLKLFAFQNLQALVYNHNFLLLLSLKQLLFSDPCIHTCRHQKIFSLLSLYLSSFRFSKILSIASLYFSNINTAINSPSWCPFFVSWLRLLAMPTSCLTICLSSSFILDRKSTRLNSSHANISYAVF